MNTETLALLSAMAPKEPEQWALDEWMERFKKDYPEPWKANFSTEFIDACMVTRMARAYYLLERRMYYAEAKLRYFSENLANQPHSAWSNWRKESCAEWGQKEWPLIWAKKHMQSVIDSENTK